MNGNSEQALVYYNNRLNELVVLYMDNGEPLHFHKTALNPEWIYIGELDDGTEEY